MPAIGKFGFHFAIKRAYIEQPGNGFIYSFDRANHKLRIFLGAAVGAITCNAVTAGTPAGNVSIPATNAVTAGTPAGNVASNALTLDPHSHGLEVASNSAGDPVAADAALYGNATGPRLQANRAANVLIPGGVTANGGVANATPTGVLAGKGLTMDAMATHVHAAPGNVALVGDAMATHVHGLTGAGGTAEAALAEMDSGVAPAATTLYMEMVGR